MELWRILTHKGACRCPLYSPPIKPISSHAHNDIWAKYLRTINACSNMMAIYQFQLAFSNLKKRRFYQVLWARLSFKLKDEWKSWHFSLSNSLTPKAKIMSRHTQWLGQWQRCAVSPCSTLGCCWTDCILHSISVQRHTEKGTYYL